MENKEINDATSSRRLRAPVYPRSPTTTDVPRAGNSHHKHHSRRRPFENKSAAAAHFSSQSGTGCQVYHLPPSPLSRTTHASAGGAGSSVGDRSNTISQDAFSGSGFPAGSPSNQAPGSPLPHEQTAHASGGDCGGVIDGSACDTSHGALPGFSCYQMPPPSSAAPMALDPIPMLGGGVHGSESSSSNTTIPCYATFLSSLDTGLASVVGLTPFSSSVDLQTSSSYSSPPLLTQSTASVDFGSMEEYVLPPPPFEFGSTEKYELPPLPPSLSGPPPSKKPMVIDLEAVYISLLDDDDESGNNVVQYVDLEGRGGGLNTSGCDTGSTGTKAPCQQLPSSSMSLPPPAPADAWVKKEASALWGTSQLGNNTFASGGSSSAGTPQPYYYSGNTGNGITQAPWTAVPLTSSSSIPAPASNAAVKKETMDWSRYTSQLGKKPVTSGGSSSVNTDVMVAGSKQNQLSSPGTGWGSGAPGSSIQYKDDANSRLVAGFADGKFTQNDIYKIMAEKGLKEIVLKNPKRVRSILRNRETAERSKQKKVKYFSELGHKVDLMQQENKSLSGQLQSLQH